MEPRYTDIWLRRLRAACQRLTQPPASATRSPGSGAIFWWKYNEERKPGQYRRTHAGTPSSKYLRRNKFSTNCLKLYRSIKMLWDYNSRCLTNSLSSETCIFLAFTQMFFWYIRLDIQY